MQRKRKSNGFLIPGLISALASLAIVAVAPSFAGDTEPKDKPQQSQSQAQGEASETETASTKGSENTPGNDRKEGYEDNSKTPQEPNHGKGSDHDGDADADPNTAYEDDHTMADEGDNRHPSGNDRSVENGGSGNQGKAESNPDDSKGPMRYEGVQGDDKPGGPGGTDLADQDGNNGCGNDDDFNDDNNGWCGKPVKPADVSKPTCPDGSVMPANGKCGKPDEVQGGVIAKPTCPDGSIMPAGGNCGENVPCPAGTVMDASGNCLEVQPSLPEEEVLGEQIERDENPAKPEGPAVLGLKLSPALNEPVKVAGAVLPFTGGDVLIFLVLALALFASGMLIMRSSKRSHQEG